MARLTNEQWLAQSREYRHLYEDLVADGFSQADAANIVDQNVVADNLIRKLGRAPTSDEIDAAMQKL
jgi:hypothetical protein